MDEHTEVNPTTEGTGGVTITQAAALLKVHPNTVRKRIKEGALPSQRVLTPNGLVYVIPRSALPAGDDGTEPGNLEVNPAALVPVEDMGERVNLAVTAALTPLLEALEAKEAAQMAERERLQAHARLLAEELGRARGLLSAERERRRAAEAELDRTRRPWWRRILGP